MRALLISNIGELTTNAGTAGDAIVITDKVEWVGPTNDAPPADDYLDAAGRAVLPGFVDSHSHLIFAGDRAEEFAARMAGQPYTGGGIRTTVATTRQASDADLRRNAQRLVAEMRRQGSTTIEIKSGYGLRTEDEARSVRIAGELTDEVTYLGAHLTPDGVENYLSQVTGPMLAACTPYAKWVDVFCERGAFDAAEARTVLKAGIAAGLRPRIHANQLSQGDGVQLAVELDCASADHCTHLSGADVDALASSNTVATLLPGAEFSTRAIYPDARRLLDAGVTVALATDCNPGSSYTSSMPFCIALAVREMRMTPREAIWAATAGGARALRRTDVGHLGLGARADLIMLDAPSALHLAYRPGVPLVREVLHGGTVL